MDQLIALIPGWLGIDPITFYATLGVLVTVANLVGRLIPDSATGVLGVVRKACKVIGLYVGNKLTPNVSVNDVGRAIAASAPDSAIVRTAETLRDAIEGGQPAPGNELVGTIVPDQYRTDPMRAGASKTKGR